MSDWKVGRLILKVPAMSSADGEWLGRRVVEGLARRGFAPRSAIRLGAVRQSVPAPGGESGDALSSRIVDELIKSLERVN